MNYPKWIFIVVKIIKHYSKINMNIINHDHILYVKIHLYNQNQNNNLRNKNCKRIIKKLKKLKN